MSLSKSSSFSRGFTLIELMVVMTVIAILATMVLFGLSAAQKAARDAGREQIMTGIQAALARYYGDHQSYPQGVNPTLTTLCGAIDGALIPEGYLTSEPMDPGYKLPLCGPGGSTCGSGTSGNPDCGSTVLKYYYESAGTSHAGFPASNCSSSSTFVSGQNYQLALQKESGGINYFCSPQ